MEILNSFYNRVYSKAEKIRSLYLYLQRYCFFGILVLCSVTYLQDVRPPCHLFSSSNLCTNMRSFRWLYNWINQAGTPGYVARGIIHMVILIGIRRIKLAGLLILWWVLSISPMLEILCMDRRGFGSKS